MVAVVALRRLRPLALLVKLLALRPMAVWQKTRKVRMDRPILCPE